MGHVPAAAAHHLANIVIGILGEPDDAAQWGTPLWAAIGSALGDDLERPGFSRSQAAAVLGVKQGTVSQLEHRGTLPRRDDGSISRAAVFARLLGRQRYGCRAAEGPGMTRHNPGRDDASYATVSARAVVISDHDGAPG